MHRSSVGWLLRATIAAAAVVSSGCAPVVQAATSTPSAGECSLVKACAPCASESSPTSEAAETEPPTHARGSDPVGADLPTPGPFLHPGMLASASDVSSAGYQASQSSAAGRGRMVTPPESVVGRHRPFFRRCFEADRTSGASGKVELLVYVAEDGQVSHVEVKPRGKIPVQVVDCLESRALAMHFSAPQGGVVLLPVSVVYVRQ